MEVLHRLGCAQMQGFLFSRAVTPDDLRHWLEHTVLPRKAAWIGLATDGDGSFDDAGGQGFRRFR
jgi:hypothetical protein